MGCLIKGSDKSNTEANDQRLEKLLDGDSSGCVWVAALSFASFKNYQRIFPKLPNKQIKDLAGSFETTNLVFQKPSQDLRWLETIIFNLLKERRGKIENNQLKPSRGRKSISRD